MLRGRWKVQIIDYVCLLDRQIEFKSFNDRYGLTSNVDKRLSKNI